MIHQSAWFLRLFWQEVLLAFVLARPSAGKSIEARMAMIAMTTNSSINVKPIFPVRLVEPRRGHVLSFGLLISSTIACTFLGLDNYMRLEQSRLC
jgi:hypothetical protein